MLNLLLFFWNKLIGKILIINRYRKNLIDIHNFFLNVKNSWDQKSLRIAAMDHAFVLQRNMKWIYEKIEYSVDLFFFLSKKLSGLKNNVKNWIVEYGHICIPTAFPQSHNMKLYKSVVTCPWLYSPVDTCVFREHMKVKF